jgi:hypothetical protein
MSDTHAGKAAGTDRRNFMKGAAVIGFAAATSGIRVPVAVAQAAPVPDPATPKGVKPGGQVDNRFSVTHRESVPESIRIISQYFTALSERNLDGMAQMMHYPFLTHEDADAILVESPEQLIKTPPLSMNVTGKGATKIQAGAYDILDNIQMHIYSPIGTGLTLEYSRFDHHGNKLYSCHGLYGITNNDGKWGIEWASTIFKPINQVDRDDWYNFPIANTALHESHRDHVMARRYGDLEDLRRTVYDPYPHGSLWIGASNSPNAGAGHPMDDFKIKGVKSRLRYSPGDTKEQIEKQNYNQKQFSTASGAGVGPWALSIETPDTRMLYSSAEKGHFYAGYFRYTEEGAVISEHRYLGALVNRRGTWYGNDISRIIGHSVYQDRTNDDLT